ncbi:MAG: PilC/PilY family type IV pilus protein [Granulosicoccus sp.]
MRVNRGVTSLISTPKCLVVFQTLCLTAASLFAGLSAADDTEIYFAKPLSENQSVANILFMFDTSGSMKYGSGGAGGPRRIDSLKQAMIDVVDSANNVNIGLGAFNGFWAGGAVLFPATNVESDLCPDASCANHEIRASIKRFEDDAVEDADGSVQLYGEELNFELTGSGSNVVALRFDDLNIPRGATINHAALEFSTAAIDAVGAKFTIVGLNSDDAPEFGTTPNALSTQIAGAAQRTVTSVDWPLGEWRLGDGDNGSLKERSADISSVITEIVNRPGWCGGNAMALFVTTDGNRAAVSSDGNVWEAPVLRVDYDPSSVDFSNTCLRQTVSSSVANGTDDITKSLADASLDIHSEYLRTHIADQEQIIGVRFASLAVPQGASITNAYIQLSSAGFGAGDVDLQIDVESTGYAAVFSAAEITGSRTMSGSPALWSDVPALTKGNSLRTPDLSSLVSATVARADWIDGNAIAFSMSVAPGSAGQRFFSAIDAPSGSAAKLVVSYQLDGTALAGQPIPLKTARNELIKAMLDLNSEGGTPLLDAYYEASQYMRGAAVDFGTQRHQNGADRFDRYFRVSHPDSYTGGTLYVPPACSEYDLNSVACVDSEIQGNPVYIQPEFGQCQSNQIVLLSDGTANASGSADRIKGITGVSGCSERDVNAENCGVELAEWLYTTDHDTSAAGKQGIITHTVGFNFSAPILKDMAAAGGGEFYPADSASDLTKAFRSIIETAVSLDTSFVAPTATVSQTNRLVNSSDIYYAMFKPDTKALWDGNLKRYQLAKNSSTGLVDVLDSLAAPAVNPVTGAIADTAKSFWSSSTDGATVSAGGAAEQLTLTRDLYVSLEDTSGVVTGLSSFHEDTNAITKDLLGIAGADANYREELLQWARGVDIKDFDEDGDTSEVRTQMGDPLHSSQYLLNYIDGTGNKKSVIFVGTNHGFLHAINTDDGTEEFAYIPQELLTNLDHFYKNETVNHDRRPYGLDGEISGWHADSNNNGFVDAGEKAYIYIGMRRGGRNYYALDVSDIDSPEFKWMIKGGTGDFADLGQTWSRPVKTRVKYSGTARDVLIFSGGYDADKDSQDVRTADDVGAGIYLVDASTGALVTSRDGTDFSAMNYSIPSDIRVINLDNDGFADMMWVGDTGGQVWRFDIDNHATNDTGFLRGAVAADFGNVGTVQNRRFFYEPDVALIKSYDGGLYLNVAIGSGFRAHPNDEVVQDRFYVFRTSDVFGPPTDASGVVDYSGITMEESDLVDVSTQSGQEDETGDIRDGWYFDLPDTGEKVLSSALTVDNTITFTTYVPAVSSSDVCSVSIGGGRVYSVDAFFGDPANEPDPTRPEDLVNDRYVTLKTPGIPPRVVGLIAESNPNAITQLAGLESVGDDEAGEPFKRIFWAEQ